VAPRLMTSPFEGGVWKFHDYASVIGLPLEFEVLQSPPRGQIERLQAELFDLFRTLPKVVTDAAA